ncbi:hypothetical protein BJY16_006372 [Actinoplanes octamycinicus]|uniref:Uncharacterized protein n=1 Tax=Actinoplanes octamycinicus TaxID=135948 RepID=A0A7W7H2V9_9ACTN|nr:hypothetical protein [Actinoplanes octamycinicus]MBB4742913.1 hypothetical protein [Actinoplanes octamycinicus]GIE58234.1 hypothetical protein Aoc01nite_36360 [Actinoplanes octamycinicus]
MVTARDPRTATRSLLLVLALALTAVLGVQVATRAVSHATNGVSAVAVEHVPHSEVTADVVVRPNTPLPATAGSPVADRASSLQDQHAADVRGSRAPPAIAV